MTPWAWLKARFNRDGYSAASIGIMEGAGAHGAKPRPFDYQAAVGQFQSWVYAAAMLNAQAVATVPLRLYVRRRNRPMVFRTRPVPAHRKRYLLGGDDTRPSTGVIAKLGHFSAASDFEEVEGGHPALELLRTVNPYMNGYGLTTLRILLQELTGNFYLHPIIDQSLGRPVELWPMLPQWVQIIPSRENFIEGYVYGQSSTDRQEFTPDEVIHFKYPNPDNLFYGKGKVEAGWSVLSMQNAKRQMDIANFDNNARPDYLLIVKGATQEQLDGFESKIRGKLKGVTKAGRFLTLTGDVTATPLNFPPKDLGDPEQVVEEIAGVFGVPVSMLKANDPNRSSAEVGNASWRNDTILPLCRRDEEKLNEGYLPLFGIDEDAVLAYDDPVPKNQQFELDRQLTLVRMGLLTINEARAERGFEPLDDGDVARVNGVPLDQVGRQPGFIMQPVNRMEA